MSVISEKYKELIHLRKQVAELELQLEIQDESFDELCRMIEIRNATVPICGHDVLTEFMIEDLDKNPHDGIYFYGGLFAPNMGDDFHWYVSTIRISDQETITKNMSLRPNAGQFLASVFEETAFQILSTLYVKSKTIEDLSSALSITQGKTETILSSLEKMGLIIKSNDLISLTSNGTQAVILGAHLCTNVYIKPPVDKMNLIISCLEKSLGEQPKISNQSGFELQECFDLVKKTSCYNELPEDISDEDIKAVIGIYYIDPR